MRGRWCGVSTHDVDACDHQTHWTRTVLPGGWLYKTTEIWYSADFCSRHAEPDMVDFVKQRCGHPDCTKGASFGTAGSKKREFCSQHARKEMINLAKKCCGHPWCTKIPSFGAAGSKKREFCCQHAKQGMVDLVRNRGGRPGCTNSPSFDEAGSKKAELCHLGTPTQV